MTHVAIICDDPALQPLLPQFVIGNCAVFLQREWRALQASCPSNVVLVRQKSAWNNTKLFCEILRQPGVVLRPFLCSVQPGTYSIDFFFDRWRTQSQTFTLTTGPVAALMFAEPPGYARARGAVAYFLIASTVPK